MPNFRKKHQLETPKTRDVPVEWDATGHLVLKPGVKPQPQRTAEVTRPSLRERLFGGWSNTHEQRQEKIQSETLVEPVSGEGE